MPLIHTLFICSKYFKINIFGFKMILKEDLEKKIIEIPPCEKPFSENLFDFIVLYFIEKGFCKKLQIQ